MTLECGDEGVKSSAQRYRTRGSSRVFEIIANPLLRLLETEPRESSSTAAPRGHFIDDIRVSLPHLPFLVLSLLRDSARRTANARASETFVWNFHARRALVSKATPRSLTRATRARVSALPASHCSRVA